MTESVKTNKKLPKLETLLKGIAPAKQRFKIVSWNVNGLRSLINNPGLLDTYISQEAPDALFMQETKLSDNGSQFAKLISGYTAYFNSCSVSDRKGYSGVALFAKRTPFKVTYGIGKRDMDKEGRVLTAEYEKFYIVGCYVPNSGDGLRRLEFRVTEWDIALRNYIKSLESKKPVILCGDLNVAHQDRDIYDCLKTYNKYAGNTKEEKENFTELLKQGYVDVFRALYPYRTQYSYWGYRHHMKESNRGWRLDYFVVSKKLLDTVDDSTMRDKVPGSDHCPIVLTLLTGKETRNSPIVVPPLPLTTVPVGYKGPRKSKSKEMNETMHIKMRSKRSDEDSDYSESKSNEYKKKVVVEKENEKVTKIEEKEEEKEKEEENEEYMPTANKRGPYKKHKRWYKKKTSTTPKKKPVVKFSTATVAGAIAAESISEEEEEEEEEEENEEEEEEEESEEEVEEEKEENNEVEKKVRKKPGRKPKKLKRGGRRTSKIGEVEEEVIEVKPIKINDDLTITPSSITKKTVKTGRGILMTHETVIINAADFEKARAISHSRRPSIIEENKPIKLASKRNRKYESEPEDIEMSGSDDEEEEVEEEPQPPVVKKKRGRKSKAEKLAEELERIAAEAEAEAKAKEKEKLKKKSSQINKKTKKEEKESSKTVKYENGKKSKKHHQKNLYEKQLKPVVSYKETKTYHRHTEEEEKQEKLKIKKELSKTKRPYHKHTYSSNNSKLVELPTKRPYHKHNQTNENKQEESTSKRPYHKHKHSKESNSSKLKEEEVKVKRPYHKHKQTNENKSEELPAKRPYHRHKEINENFLQELPPKRPYHKRSTKTTTNENQNENEKENENKGESSNSIATIDIDSITELEEPSQYQKGRRGRKSNAQLEEEMRIYREMKRKLEERKKMMVKNNEEEEENNNNKLNTDNNQQQQHNNNDNSVDSNNNYNNKSKVTTSDFFQQTDFVRNIFEDKINQNISKETQLNTNTSNVNTNTTPSSQSQPKPMVSPHTVQPLSINRIVSFLTGSGPNINTGYAKEKTN